MKNALPPGFLHASRVQPFLHRRRRAARGFTLIELLVVIAIIAILASLLVPVLAGGKVSVRKSLCLSNQRQISLSTQMYADDFNGAFPKADNADHTLWIKRMLSTKYFSTLKIFEDPAEIEGGNDYTKLRTFPITIDGKREQFIGSYGINERLAGPNGIMMPTYQSVPQPTSIFFFGCATYFISPDWDHERVYNAGGPQPIGATVNPPRRRYARHGSGAGSKPGSVITYVDGHAQFHDQVYIQKNLRWLP
jgi:prepilin-type N-terminal cleavage/methylation domain-containing protein